MVVGRLHYFKNKGGHIERVTHRERGHMETGTQRDGGHIERVTHRERGGTKKE